MARYAGRVTVVSVFFHIPIDKLTHKGPGESPTMRKQRPPIASNSSCCDWLRDLAHTRRLPAGSGRSGLCVHVCLQDASLFCDQDLLQLVCSCGIDARVRAKGGGTAQVVLGTR